MTKEKLNEIKCIITELESKSVLTKSETFKLARYRVILKNPEKPKESSKKAVETVKNKIQKEKEITSKKRTEVMNNRWAKLKSEPKKLKERNNKISKSNTGKKRSKRSIEKQKKKTTGRKMTGERLVIQQNVIQSLHERHGNPGFKTKRYEIQGYICQGRSEKFHLESLIENNFQLPIKDKKYIQTPFGFYHPDFEFENRFEEIKSIYTYNIFIGQEKNHDQEYQNEQMRKVIWIGKNIKPVHLFIYENKNVIKKIIFDINYDDSNFEFKPSKIIREKLPIEERAKIAKEVGIKQRGKIRKESTKENHKNTVQKRIKEKPELHKQIYIDRENRKRLKKSLMTEKEKEAFQKKQSDKMDKIWNKLKNDPEKMKKRSEKIRASKNIPPKEVYDRIDMFLDSYTSVYPKVRLRSALQFSLTGEFIKEHMSIQSARKETNITTIMDCVKGRQDTSGGFIWRIK